MTALPAAHDLVAAQCGCTGPVVYASRSHGGHVHLRVTVPCLTGHPERVSAGVIIHLPADQTRPANISQPALFPTTTGRTAA